MPSHVRQGFVGLSSRRTGRPYTMLALNLLSQLVCVSGVNQLSSVSNITLPPPSSLSHTRPTAPTATPVPVSDCVTPFR